MSRLFTVGLVLTALSSLASAEQRFAQPPPSDAPHAIRAPQTDFEEGIIVDRAQVRAKLATNRADNLTRFRAYQATGVFPSNTFDDRKLNVWRDKDGHLCAAATIMNMSGQTDLVQRVATQNNFIRLGDQKQGPVMDWILTSGLTQDEIAAIQEPFMPVGNEPNPSRYQGGLVDARKRSIEDQRLLAKYKQVEAMIVKNQRASLDAATDRLMRNPQLAERFLGLVDG